MYVYFYAFLSLVIFSCGTSKDYAPRIPGYNFSKPSATHQLPDILQEISGLTDIDNHSIGCVQDEDGILFIYDLKKKKIREQFSFKMEGDYEGITNVGDTMYVLRSDGMILEIPSYRESPTNFESYQTDIPAANNEGLCHDSKNNRLLIASKSKPDKEPENKNLRVIYGFDLTTKSLSENPIYEINVETVKEFAEQQKFEKNTGRETEKIKLRYSAIAIHPVTGDLYVLSATDHLLLVFSNGGTIKHIQTLDDDMFNKAEGITFFENGDMVVTNEGEDDGYPTLLHFRYKK